MRPKQKLIKTIICGSILAICVFILSACSGDPIEKMRGNIETGNYAKAVAIYNADIVGTDQESDINSVLKDEINALVEKWDCEELEVDVAVDYLNDLTALQNTELATLATENSKLVSIEGNGRILHIQAEDYYANDQLADAMSCVVQMDPEYSLYDNAKELYNTSETIILETVATPYSSEDCTAFAEQLDGYLKIVENKKFAARKDELQNLVREYVQAEAIVEDVATLWDNGQYKKCFEKLANGIKQYPENNLLILAQENCRDLYIIQVTQVVLGLCEKEDYKQALAEVNVAKEIYDCDEFDELKESIWKQKSLTYRIASSVVDNFKAFTHDAEGERLSVKEIGSKTGAYVVKSGKRLALGDYSNEDVTVLSFTGDMVASLAGVDLIADIRDLSYDVVHWGEEEYFMVYLAADAIALLPAIGVIKYLDLKSMEKTVDALKHTDNITDAAKNAGKVADVADSIIDNKTIYKNVGEAVDNAKEISILSKVKGKHIRYVTKPTRNARYKGQVHKGVKFNEKKLKYSEGRRYVGVFPEFEYVYEVKLDESLYLAEESAHFKECNKQLKNAISKDSKLKKEFTAEQIQEIETGIKGNAPEGFTWHHNEREGVLQLVDAETHRKVGHTGGFSMWGAGSLRDAS